MAFGSRSDGRVGGQGSTNVIAGLALRKQGWCCDGGEESGVSSACAAGDARVHAADYTGGMVVGGSDCSGGRR